MKFITINHSLVVQQAYGLVNISEIRVVVHSTNILLV